MFVRVRFVVSMKFVFSPAAVLVSCVLLVASADDLRVVVFVCSLLLSVIVLACLNELFCCLLLVAALTLSASKLAVVLWEGVVVVVAVGEESE